MNSALMNSLAERLSRLIKCSDFGVTRFRLQIALATISGIVAFVHFCYLTNNAVDIPYWDEWTMVSLLKKGLDFREIFSPNNEHNIVFTKLQTLTLYWLGGWNIAAEVTVNFFLYISLVFSVTHVFARSVGSKYGFIITPFLFSMRPWFNHIWGFQSAFHYVLLFFVWGLFFSREIGWRRWFAVALAICSIWSLATGVACAIAIAANMVLQAVLRRHRLTEPICCATVIIAMALVWYLLLPRQNYQTSPTSPLNLDFWRALVFMVSVGFGGNGYVIGILGLLGGCAACLWRFYSAASSEKKAETAAIATFALGILGCFAVVSYGRASFGVAQVANVRYATIASMILPAFWFLIEDLPDVGGGFRRLVTVAFVLGMIWSFKKDYNFAHYQTQSIVLKHGVNCVRKILQDETAAGTCPDIAPGDLRGPIEAAKQLGINFTTGM